MASQGLVSKSYKEVCEDWVDAENLATSAADGVKWLISSDAGNTAFAITATTAGSILRAATDTTDDDMCEVGHSVLVWSAQTGELSMETRVRLDDVTNVAFTVGFNDDQLEDSNTLPVELSTTTFTSNASTFVGIVFDVDATNDDVHVFWVDDDNDTSTAIANLRFNGIAPVNNQWFGVRVVLTDRGSGNGVRAEITVVEESTGKMAQKVFDTTVDRDAYLTPHIAFENRSGTAHQFDVDYIYVRMSRGS